MVDANFNNGSMEVISDLVSTTRLLFHAFITSGSTVEYCRIFVNLFINFSIFDWVGVIFVQSNASNAGIFL
jgi:hypothetical protein